MQISRLGGSGAVRASGTQKTRTHESAMTGGFIRAVQEHARKDAQRGVYMGQDYIQFQNHHMRQYVSPDRSGPMMQVSAALRELAKEREPVLELLDRLLGNCSAKVRHDPMGQTAEIRAPNGEVIASYSSLGGGWTKISTKEENKFHSAAAMVYSQAYREARAAMQPPASDAGTAVDIQV